MIVAQLAAYEPSAARWQQWQSAEPILAGRGFSDIRCDLMDRSVPPEQKDAVLAALIRRSRSNDGEAARVATIACLLPGALNLASRFARVVGRHDAIAEVLASLCTQLDQFDPTAHPDRIANRLLTRARHHLTRRADRELTWRQHTTGEVDIGPADEPPSAPGRTVLADAVSAGVLGDIDATLIEATRLRGLSLVDTAALLGLSYEAAKKRRRRAEVGWLMWSAPERRPVASGLESKAA